MTKQKPAQEIEIPDWMWKWACREFKTLDPIPHLQKILIEWWTDEMNRKLPA